MIVASTPSEAAQRREFVPLLGADGQHHPLLGLGNPDLGVGQALVFHRRAFQPHLGADLLAHLAHGAGESAGPAVGDGVKQAAIAGLQNHVDDHLFGDRVADLHRAAREAFALVRQFGRAERGAVNAVAAGAPADGHDVVARAAVP